MDIFVIETKIMVLELVKIECQTFNSHFHMVAFVSCFFGMLTTLPSMCSASFIALGWILCEIYIWC